MNRLQLALKSESRYIYFLVFLAFCQLMLPLAGPYIAICTVLTVSGALGALFKMWKSENKEFNPRASYRELVTMMAGKVPQKAPVRRRPIGVYRPQHA